MLDKLSHLDDAGRSRMVDVSAKKSSHRRAIAEARLHVPPSVMTALGSGDTPKGNVFEVARLAGIMAAKSTSALIPLCHALPLDHVDVTFECSIECVRITAYVTTHAKTGVEMEALTASSVAALTLYDMLKALSHAMTIEHVRLLNKTGGKSGDYTVEAESR